MHRSTRSHQPHLSLPLGNHRKSSRKPASHAHRKQHLEEYVEIHVRDTVGPSCDIIDEPVEKDLKQGIPHLESVQEKFGTTSPAMDSGGAPPPPYPIPINPLVQPRGLPIVIPLGLQAAPMPPNLPTFGGTRDEDPSAHVERFQELLTTCLITDPRYYLVWFSSTLKDAAYEWYRNHPPNTFVNWDMLMAAFLEQFMPEVGQSNALTALAALRQGKNEEITTYIRRFELVVTRFVGALLTDDTLIHFFIQGFNNEGTIREILRGRFATLEVAKSLAKMIEQIDKEQERMWRKEDQRIPSFIPIHAQNMGSSQGPLQSAPSTHFHLAENYPQPLDVRPPPILSEITYPDERVRWKEEVKKEIFQSQQGFQDQLAQQIKMMQEHMTLLIENQNLNQAPPPIESGRHASGLWCTQCGQSGHTSPFCTMLPMQQQQPGRPQPHGPSHNNQANAGSSFQQQGYDFPNQRFRGQPKQRYEVHNFWGNRHAPGNCWVENQVVCGNCGGNHPTETCRRPDWVIPLNFPPGNYQQQAQDNMRGSRNPNFDNTLRPPNLFYDYNNNCQN